MKLFSILLTLNLLMAGPIPAQENITASRQSELSNFLIQDCGSCHGLKMKGGLGPALLPSTLKGKSAEFLTATILHGRPGTAMPAWGPLLSPADARWMATVLLRGELQ